MIYFGRKFWGGIAVSGAVLIWTLSSAGQNEDGLKTGLLVVLGGVIGILFAPAPKPVDHEPTATAAVERMMDMAREIKSVQETVTDVVEEVEPMTALRLVEAQNALLRQIEMMERSVSDWNEISPGVVVAVTTKRDAGKRRFLELTKEEQNG